MHAVDIVFLLVLAVVQPVVGHVQYRRYVARIRSGHPADRIGQYRDTERMLWAALVVLCLAWWGLGRDWAWLGMVANRGEWFWPTLAAVALAVGLLLHGRRSTTALTVEQCEQQRLAMGDLEHFLPATATELRHFQRMSFAAGVVEELVYRGYLIWLFGLAMPIWAAVLLSSLCFGLAHSYQGIRGMFITATMGIFLALVYIGSGSIWLPILAHFLVNLLQGATIYQILHKAPTPAPPRP